MFGNFFLFLILISEAALLFVAAQTGFLDGPRVMANMAHDNWLPRRFTLMSDRLVSQNGIILMGVAAFFVILLSKGLVTLLVVLYSINVFITFSLSQFGMVRHWIGVRKTERRWFRRLLLNGIGFILTTFILSTVVIIKFHEGGWITVIITGALVFIATVIKRHYYRIGKEIVNIQRVMNRKIPEQVEILKNKLNSIDKNTCMNDSTAVILVNGYSGIGLYSLFNLLNIYYSTFKNFVFVQVGIVDSGCYQSSEQIENLKQKMELDMNKYRYLIRQIGCNSDYRYAIGTDVAEEVDKILPEILARYPNSTFIGGQIIFNGMYRIAKILHNFTIFSIQRRLYKHGIMTIIIPISIDKAYQINNNL